MPQPRRHRLRRRTRRNRHAKLDEFEQYALENDVLARGVAKVDDQVCPLCGGQLEGRCFDRRRQEALVGSDDEERLAVGAR